MRRHQVATRGWRRGVLRWIVCGVVVLPARPATAQAGTVILVRHAEKASPNGDPALSSAGRSRAQALAATLRAWPLDRIIISQFRRSRETAEPVAAAQGRTPTIVALGGDRAEDTRRVVSALSGLPAGAAVLVVGHSNTLLPIVAAWGGPTLPDLCDGRYDARFVLQRAAGDSIARLLVATYGAATPEGDRDCPEMR